MIERTHAMDASALLAILHREPGWESAAHRLSSALMSAANWSEVAQKMTVVGETIAELWHDLEGMGLSVVAFDRADAEAAARLWPETRSAGLSLGDRACLALARRRKLTAVTADRSWRALAPLLNIAIEVIR